MINNAELIPIEERIVSKSINPKTGSRAIISSVETEIGIASDIHNTKHDVKTPMALIGIRFSGRRHDKTIDNINAKNANTPKPVFLFLKNFPISQMLFDKRKDFQDKVLRNIMI